MKKFALIVPDDAFGTAVSDGVTLALKGHASAPVAKGVYPRQTTNVDSAIETAKAASPDVVAIVGPYASCAAIVKKSHEKGWKPLFVTVSFVGTDDFIREAGRDAEGTVITQVVPPYYLTDLSGVAAYRRALQKYLPGAKPTFVALEGFTDAVVMVEAIKRSGKDLTRAKFMQELETMHPFDLGLGPKLKVTFTKTEHKGLSSVFPTIVTGGIAVPITDWKQAKPKWQ